MLLFAACKNKSYTGSNGVEYKSALEYNDYIIGKQKEVVTGMTNYGNAAQLNADSAERILDHTIDEISKSLNDLKGMPAYNGDSSFRDGAIELFTFYKKSFSNEFKEMLTINRKIEKDNYDESDIARFKQIEESITKQEAPLDAKLKDMQTRFAKANNLKLGNNTLQEQIDKMKK